MITTFASIKITKVIKVLSKELIIKIIDIEWKLNKILI